MNTLKNKVQLIGNIGRMPVIYTTPKGKKVARFSVATVEAFKDKGGNWNNQTHWHQVVAWGKTALLIGDKANKGTEIALEGKLITRPYTNKDGVTTVITEIEARQCMIIQRNKVQEVTKQQKPF